ncbi:3-hydroxyisobutyryl-CoA hydrolase, mitochondrial [Lachnellula subtilissima]|uniref:3-hydroxyisobutyryl-CoA hydrolase n=1 Tax=Lachnellula subtilissima TaxID=602034 RepID=A0A8H8U438_9HELO|nr:3-hydroxyisobutyryl-CoA hydrolase, mitochondrial [Lachnellula subtilissima]
MPLTAKVMNPAFTGSTKAKMSTLEAPEQIKELPGDEKEDVLFDTLFGLRTIELNRPIALNALNGSMVRKIVPRLQEWAKSDMANVVVLKGAGGKALCAGGDVTSLAKDNKLGEEGQQRSIDYFALEYKLDHLIATYTKPYVAIMDGITMGGGVGLSLHAPFRIATEKTLFAMPETTIGFFPDVGASFFLPRMAGSTGTYLALTSERLKGVDVYYAGVATHYIHSTSLPALERRLAELRFKDYDSLDERLDLIDSTIEEYTTGLPHDQPMLLSGPLRKSIDACFSADTVEELINRLNKQAANNRSSAQWAEKTLLALKLRSPTSLHVTFQQMKLGRKWSIKEAFQREHQIASKFMRHPDFTEGVHALLIRKDKSPAWAEPSKLEDVKNPAALTTPFFEVEEGKELKLLTEGNYKEYPHLRFGLPHESQIEEVVKKGNRTIPEVVSYFVREKRGKQGVKEVVEEVLARRAYSAEGGKAAWL